MNVVNVGVDSDHLQEERRPKGLVDLFAVSLALSARLAKENNLAGEPNYATHDGASYRRPKLPSRIPKRDCRRTRGKQYPDTENGEPDSNASDGAF